MVKINSVEIDSLAERANIQSGDILVAMNGHPVHDFLDYRFFQSDEKLRIDLSRDGKSLSMKIAKSYDEDLGLDIESPAIRACSNNCVFCFIRQNPNGMRKPIYFFDEDYRYSFLYGNYVTLTDIGDDELERIVRQRLSPLYISVHATDPAVRKRLLRFRGEDRLMEKMDFLARHRIDMHTQIVLIPGWNDGEILHRTIRDLYGLKSHIKSVAVAPVGLTKHRQHLPQLQNVNPDQAKALLKQSRIWDKLYRNDDGCPFVYFTDEFYLLAGQAVPSGRHYGAYYQIENGVGIVRDMLDSFKRQQRKFPASVTTPRRILFVTGTLAAPVLEKIILPRLNAIGNLHVEVFPVINQFYGETVTVAGLLTGRDIVRQIRHLSGFDAIWLPSRCLNETGVLLDDMTPDEIQKELKTPVRIFQNDFMEIFENAR
ncbi:MAG: DUF512 domain-containing protein [Candidatus Neomarinimicrobiota bacterium]